MLIRRTLVCLLAGAALAVAGPAFTSRTEAQPASHGFTPQAPSYKANGRYGTLNAQINYRRQRFQWSWQLYARTCASATGPMVETADLYRDGHRIKKYRDQHVRPACYFVHSSYGPVTTQHSYQLAVNETFPIERNGRPGVRRIHMRFNFVVTLV